MLPVRKRQAGVQKVIRLFRNITENRCTVMVEVDGKTEAITSAPGHKYYLPDNIKNREIGLKQEHENYYELSEKWVSACHLKKGDKVLLPNDKYGRYGDITANSNYITQAGASPSQLSLSPWNNGVYTEITVLKSIPNVVQSTAAPWGSWNGVGGGIQYMLPKSIETLKKLGYLIY